MNPIIKHVWTPEELARQGIRGIDDFTAEELALIQQKVEGWIGWRRRGRWRMPTASEPPAGKSPATLAFEAFTHGNSYLAEGKFADAIAAFQRARELDPKRLHVADRLAEAERRQHAASPPPPAGASS